VLIQLKKIIQNLRLEWWKCLKNRVKANYTHIKNCTVQIVG